MGLCQVVSTICFSENKYHKIFELSTDACNHFWEQYHRHHSSHEVNVSDIIYWVNFSQNAFQENVIESFSRHFVTKKKLRTIWQNRNKSSDCGKPIKKLQNIFHAYFRRKCSFYQVCVGGCGREVTYIQIDTTNEVLWFAIID